MNIIKRLIILLTLSLLFGCDKTDELKVQDKVVYKLRFGHDMPEDSAHHAAALKFAESIRQRTAGQLEISVHPAQTIGNDHEMIAMAQNGELDIILPPTAKLATIAPSFQLTDLPFLFDTREDAHRTLDGPAGNALLGRLTQYGLVGISFWEGGFKHLTSNKKIKKINDLNYLKFRIMRSPMIRDQFESWGSETIAIEFYQTYKALKEGVVDGQENPLGTIYGMKFHEVQEQLLLTQHGYLAQVLAVSKKSYDKLPAALQQLLTTVGHEMTIFQRQELQRRETEILDKLKQTNITITRPDKTLINKLKTLSEITLEKQRLSIGTDIIELALQSVNESRPVDNDNLIIALDADMAGNSAISGLAIRRGIELAISEINSKGGVLGKKLQLVIRDNSMVSARGIDNLKRFVKIPNLVAVFGGISSPVVLSELEFIHNNKILFLDPWAAATNIIDNNYHPSYVFRLSVRDEYAAQYLLKQAMGISKKIALLLVNNDWGRSNYASITKELNKHKITPVLEYWFDWGDKFLTNKLTDITNSSAEVIIYVGNVVEASRVVRQISQSERQLPVISHWGTAGGDLPKLAGPSLDTVKLLILQTFSFINNKSQIATRVAKQYRQRYAVKSNNEILAPVGTAHAYDLTHLLAKAIKLSGTINMPKIRDAMEKLPKHTGLVRTYNPPFTPQRHEALDHNDYFLARYKDGILIPVR